MVLVIIIILILVLLLGRKGKKEENSDHWEAEEYLTDAEKRELRRIDAEIKREEEERERRRILWQRQEAERRKREEEERERQRILRERQEEERERQRILRERQEEERRAKARKELERQLASFCKYADGVSKEQFDEIIRSAEKIVRRRRISLTVNRSVVVGTVESASGLSTWQFSLDFNDNGHMTGQVRIRSENDDSKIPFVIAKHISEQIREQREACSK